METIFVQKSKTTFMRHLYILFVLAFLVSCKPEKKALTAQQIIDRSIKATGTDKVAKATIEFDFRNRKYIATRDNGKFMLERVSIKDTVLTNDKLSNNGFERFINEEFIILPDSMSTRYASSVNSVHYFSVLPYGLNDAAVRKNF